MRKYTCPLSGTPLIWLGVDEFATSDKTRTIKTILGSCVGIILYDLKKYIFGVNHFLNTNSGRPLTEKLENEMKEKGCTNIVAVIAGGANKKENSLNVGAQNIKFAQQYLQHAKIPISQEYVGGISGRTITVSLENRNINFESITHRNDPDHSDTQTNKHIRNALDNFKTIYDKSVAKNNKFNKN